MLAGHVQGLRPAAYSRLIVSPNGPSTGEGPGSAPNELHILIQDDEYGL